MNFNVIAKILISEQFEIEGKKFVRLQGFINDLGVFKQTVREDLVPDSIEGKDVCLCFGLGLDNSCKPYLKLKGLSLDTNIKENMDIIA